MSPSVQPSLSFCMCMDLEEFCEKGTLVEDHGGGGGDDDYDTISTTTILAGDF